MTFIQFDYQIHSLDNRTMKLYAEIDLKYIQEELW